MRLRSGGEWQSSGWSRMELAHVWQSASQVTYWAPPQEWLPSAYLCLWTLSLQQASLSFLQGGHEVQKGQHERTSHKAKAPAASAYVRFADNPQAKQVLMMSPDSVQVSQYHVSQGRMDAGMGNSCVIF